MIKHSFDLTYSENDYVDKCKRSRVLREQNAYNEIENGGAVIVNDNNLDNYSNVRYRKNYIDINA